MEVNVIPCPLYETIMTICMRETRNGFCKELFPWGEFKLYLKTLFRELEVREWQSR